MRDYSNYHINSSDKIISDGKRLLNLSLNGLNGVNLIINGLSVDAVVYDKFSETETLKNIISDSDLLVVGSIIELNNSYWIVRALKNNEVYKKGIMKLCPSTLKWLSFDGIVKETPFTLKSSPSTAYPLQEDKIIILSKERRTILIQANDDTKQIKKDKRFIFDGRAWRVVGFNGLNEGLLELTLEEDQFNEAVDNVSLRIADYAGNVANYKVTILNGESFSIKAGSTLQLQVEVKNKDEIVLKDVTFSSSDTSIATISPAGLLTGIANGEVVITATLKDNPVIQDTTTVTIQLATTNNYTVSILGTSPINVNYSKTFTSEVKNNGVTETGKYVSWYLYDDDGVSPTTKATISSTLTQCTIKGLSIGYVKLKCVVNGIPSATVTERIQIKSLI